ncbi:MAG: cytochrome c biogenesis protein CcdA [Candidatus Taylorbacteria bacterium]|nr:cytochrome c biogenesis protein CcdA [Candidatus Taylorbacteria bacterium]
MSDELKTQEVVQPSPAAGAVASVSDKARHWIIVLVFGLAVVIGLGLIWAFFGSSTQVEGFGWYLFSYAMGLTMIVLPCTFPLAFVIVPLSMGKGPVKGLGMALAFGAGIVITLSMYGILAAIIGKTFISSFGVQAEGMKNWLYFIAGIIAYLFALGELGLIKFKMPTYSGAAPKIIQEKKDYVKALMLGLFLGNIGIGCPHPATPLIFLEIARSGNIFYGWSLFFVHAVARVLPLLLLAFLGILGVNGLSWLSAHREKVEKATAWMMVFVAGFILVLGLFTHDWWVNSGQHTLIEQVTREEVLLDTVGNRIGTTKGGHAHGMETGEGLFGLPLSGGSWVLVFLWLLPLWWWFFREHYKVEVKVDKH